MTSAPAPLQLPACLPGAAQAGRPVLVGFSGGLDSTVLLHLLAMDAATRRTGLRAIHIHHGLQAAADAWASHCQRTCAALDVPLAVVRVAVDRSSGLGPEGAARSARYAAFSEALCDGGILALAHHQDDQAETFLLRALRGSGSDGLAAMQACRSFAHGWLWRPLLGIARDDLRAHAMQHQLAWIEDPGNAATDADRNFLRNAVLPLLRQRWPHAPAALARSAALCAQSTDLLQQDDGIALASLQLDAHTLRIEPLLALPVARRARVLRRWIERLGLPPLPGSSVARIERDLLATRSDAQPGIRWAGARMQRWRNLLHAGMPRAPLPADWSQYWDGSSALTLPTADTLQLLGAGGFDAPLRVHARRGGERIILPGRTHSHALKHVLQDSGMPPWQRERLPLLSAADGQLLAAGATILSARMAAWLEQHDARLRWLAVT